MGEFPGLLVSEEAVVHVPRGGIHTPETANNADLIQHRWIRNWKKIVLEKNALSPVNERRDGSRLTLPEQTSTVSA